MARCLEPACPDPVTYRGRCAKHNQERYARRKRDEPWRRLYRLPAMKAWARAVLLRDPVCVACGKALATEADHVLPVRDYPEKAFDLDNGQGLCKSCHSRKTLTEVR